VAPAYNQQPPALSTAEQYKANRAKYLASFKERKANAEKANSPAQTAQSSSASPSASVKYPAAVPPTPQLTKAGAKSQPTPATATPVVDREQKAEATPKESSKAEAKAAPKKEGESAKSGQALDPLISDLLADPLSKEKPGKK
jgi:hypothetical protein